MVLAISRELSPEMFEPVTLKQGEAEALTRPVISYWQDAWRRFKKNRLALFGLGILIFMGLLSIFGPYFTPYDYREQSLLYCNMLPSREHWLGTDNLGRDIFARLCYGARISLFIGIMAATMDLVIGVIYGGISGYCGGIVDDIMMRVVDVLYGIPWLIIVILLLVVMPPGLWTIILAMSITGWIGMARLVRGQILQIKEQEYVLAAQVLGASPARIIARHLVPNAMGVIIVNLTFTIPSAIFGEAFLSFIGLGVPLPLASLGSMANDGYQYLLIYPYQLFFPAIAICLIMLGFNFVGDGLRDALDPKLRQ
ncbi:MAG TPA: ABC transporter permease [Firmicutes bacterium]|nr:ABC transporter permease [Bacillota bacterium]HHY98799.1 ABC transporter permease [Bacillota bacterium]